MIETVIWAGTTLLICGASIWRIDRQISQYQQQRAKAAELKSAEAEVALLERRTAAEIASLTVEESTELRRAELQRQAAEARAAMAVAEDESLHAHRLKTEHRVITARASAQEKLAIEFARQDHQALSERDPISEYDRYLEATYTRGASYASFGSFLETLERYKQ